jgi:hypothetical protein
MNHYSNYKTYKNLIVNLHTKNQSCQKKPRKKGLGASGSGGPGSLGPPESITGLAGSLHPVLAAIKVSAKTRCSLSLSHRLRVCLAQ